MNQFHTQKLLKDNFKNIQGGKLKVTTLGKQRKAYQMLWSRKIVSAESTMQTVVNYM